MDVIEALMLETLKYIAALDHPDPVNAINLARDKARWAIAERERLLGIIRSDKTTISQTRPMKFHVDPGWANADDQDETISPDPAQNW